MCASVIAHICNNVRGVSLMKRMNETNISEEYTALSILQFHVGP